MRTQVWIGTLGEARWKLDRGCCSRRIALSIARQALTWSCILFQYLYVCTVYTTAIYRIAFSISAAHSAAPTALLNENAIEAKGIISRTKDAIPRLVPLASHPSTTHSHKREHEPGKKKKLTLYTQPSSSPPTPFSAQGHFQNPTFSTGNTAHAAMVRSFYPAQTHTTGYR